MTVVGGGAEIPRAEWEKPAKTGKNRASRANQGRGSGG
jgi:hypothetical protein